MTSNAAGLDRARILVDLRRFDEAIAVLRGVLGTPAADAEPWCLLAQSRLGLDDAVTALDAANRAVGIEPDNEWPHRLASVALTRLQRHSEALTAALTARRLAPYGGQTHTRVAETAARLGKHEEADAAASRSIELAPLQPHVWLVAGELAAQRGDRPAAEAAYRRALALDPQSGATHDALARLQLRKRSMVNAGALATAAGGFARAVKIDPRSQTSRKNLEVVLRNFLGRTAYFLFLVCFLVVRTTSGTDGSFARILPVAALAFPGLFVLRFLLGLDATVRAHLFRILRTGLVRVAAVSNAVAVAAILIGAVAPHGLRAPVSLTALLFALVARLALMSSRSKN